MSTWMPKPPTASSLHRAQSSLECWFPALVAAGVPVPRTEIITTDVNLIELLDDKKPAGFDEFMDQLYAAADRIGYPIFLRTGQGSGKYSWARTCYVRNREALSSRPSAFVDWSELVGFTGFPYNVWVVREFLPLVARFTAFSGMPVAIERRYFISDGHVRCHHPYWPPSAIRNPSVPGWRELLEDMNSQSPDEVVHLVELSERVSSVLPGKWSLDWVLGENGTWYAIDMALAGASFHWSGCPAAVPQ